MKFEYRSKHLYKLWVDLGLAPNTNSASQQFFRRREAGLFTPPQIPNKRGTWIFTKEHLKEISQAFGPGGKGEWHYENNL